VDLTTRRPEPYRPTEQGGRRRPRLGRLLQGLVAGARLGADHRRDRAAVAGV